MPPKSARLSPNPARRAAGVDETALDNPGHGGERALLRHAGDGASNEHANAQRIRPCSRMGFLIEVFEANEDTQRPQIGRGGRAEPVPLPFALSYPLLGATPAPGRSRPKGGAMTRRYETVYIFDSALEEPAITEKLQKFHGLLTGEGKGSVASTNHWGKRTLAYPIKKKDTGYYVVAQFETTGDLLPEYERAVKLDESVLRYLTVINEGEPPKPIPTTVPAVAEEEEAEEEA
jgi:small subunit ribosomal protein S6